PCRAANRRSRSDPTARPDRTRRRPPGTPPARPRPPPPPPPGPPPSTPRARPRPAAATADTPAPSGSSKCPARTPHPARAPPHAAAPPRHPERRHRLQPAALEGEPALVGQHGRVLGGQLETARRRIVGDVPRHRLPGQPLPQVTLRQARPRGQPGAVQRAGPRHRPPDAQPVAQLAEQDRARARPLGRDLHREIPHPLLIHGTAPSVPRSCQACSSDPSIRIVQSAASAPIAPSTVTTGAKTSAPTPTDTGT